MDASALNVAHQQHRRADAHVRYRRFDEAIVCHKIASEQIEEAKKLTSVTKALESLHLQQDFHNRQENIVRLKKAQFEMYKKAMENQRQKMLQITGKVEGISMFGRDDEPTSLQLAIYKTMEEADSLLELLVKRGVDNENEDMDSLKSEGDEVSRITNDVASAAVEWTKRPKDDRTVIEELRTLNQQLRHLVIQLVTQLDASSREADELRERVRILKANQIPGTTERVDPTVGHRKTSLHVITDSTGGNSSPFVFSPCSELSPDIPETLVPRVLPTLAPLEMPNFDFSVFVRQQSEGDS